MANKKTIFRRMIGGRDGKHHPTLIDVLDFPNAKNCLLDEWTIRTRKGKIPLIDERLPVDLRPGAAGGSHVIEVLDDVAEHFLLGDVDNGPSNGPSEFIIFDPHTKPPGPWGPKDAGIRTFHADTPMNNGNDSRNAGSGITVNPAAKPIGFSGPLVAGSLWLDRRMFFSFDTSDIKGVVKDLVLKTTNTFLPATKAPAVLGVELYYHLMYSHQGIVDAAPSQNDWDKSEDPYQVSFHTGLVGDAPFTNRWVILTTKTSSEIFDAGLTDDGVVWNIPDRKVDRNLIINRDGFTDFVIIVSTDATVVPPLWNFGADGDAYIGLSYDIIFGGSAAVASKRPHLSGLSTL